MNRKKWYLLVVMLLVGTLLLAACGGEEPVTEEEPTVAAPTEAPMEEPTEAPAEEPTEAPMEEPTEEPTEAPTEEPMEEPTEEPAAEPETGEPTTVIIGTTDQINSLDFADAYSIHDWELMRNVNRGLLGFEPGTVNLVPQIATDFPEISEDGLTYTFTIGEGWAYPDGTPLTAQDFVYSINRANTLEGQVAGLVVPYIDSVEAPDDQTVVITLDQPYGYFPQVLTGTPFMPTRPSDYPEDEIVPFPDTLVGVGPWQVTSYAVNEQVVLERNPNFKEGFEEGAPERVIIRYFESPTQMSLAVENGEIDVAWRILGPVETARLGDVEGLTVVDTGGGGIRYLVPNHTMEPMEQKPVRQALAYLVDREELIDRALQGRATPLYSMVPPGFLGATEAFFDMYDSPNVEAAEELLTEAGYSEENPLVFDLWYPPEHYGTLTAQVFQVLEEQFEATPMIQVNLQSQEWSTYVSALTGGEYPIGYLGWFFDYPDSSNYLEPFAQSEAAQTIGTNYANPDMDAFLAAGGASDDQEERAGIYEEAQALYADDVVTLPLYLETEYAVYNEDAVSGVVIGPALIFQYELVDLAN